MKHRSIYKFVIAALLSIGLGACASDTLRSIEGPVINEFPPNGSTNVQTSTGIYAIFAPNTYVDANTLNAQTVWLLEGETTVPVQLQYTSDILDGGTLEIIAGDLQAGTTYTVVLSNDILLGGNKLGQVLSGEAPAGGLKPGAGRVGGRPGTVWDSGKMYRDEEVPVVGQQPQGLSISVEDVEGVQQPDIISGSGEVAFTWSFATGGTPAAEPDEAPEEVPEETPACDDGVQNGDEAGVDCGGSCDPCEEPKAADGDPCTEGADCQSGVCGEDETCQVPTCDDEIQNGDETGVDCGDPCDPCEEAKSAVGEDCTEGTECESGVCGEDETCQAPACDDDIQNGDEEDVDCGGASCTPCLASIGEACQNNDDCASSACDTDGSDTCVSCLNSSHCAPGRSCVNNFCIIDVGATDLN